MRHAFRNIPPLLRPRLTVKYLLCSVAALYCSYCFLSGQPLLSSNLPPYDGPYKVGTIDVEVPCAQPRSFSDAVLKETGERPFQLETVLFTIFYPAGSSGGGGGRGHHLWVEKPIGLAAEGYARFVRINNFVTNKLFALGLWSLVGSTKIPAHVDAPLLSSAPVTKIADAQGFEDQHPISIQVGAPDKLPILVFSHGMASSRTSYTHYLASLASRGYVVAAVEHRDGSGPGSIMMRPDGTTKRVFHVNQYLLDPEPDVPELKRAQLAMRQAEVEETVRVLSDINDGGGERVHRANLRHEGAVLPEWRGRLDLDRVVVGGHSYGATLALQALKDAPTAARPFRGGIILDPGKSSGPLNGDVSAPVLVIHSQSWSAAHSVFYGRPHFDTVRDIVHGVLGRAGAAWFMTAKGTTHPSVTDAPLIEPLLLSWTTGSTVSARAGVVQYVDASEALLRFVCDGRATGVLREPVSHDEYDAKDWTSEWQVHVAPEP